MASDKEEKKGGKEGNNLLGSPTFTELENGRFKCVETSHEMLAKDIDSYSQSKRCRLGLIDFALSHNNNKPPLNMFKQDPLSRAKLICKLTGDTVNKNEEHIWKHINGKRFLNKLEQKEIEKLNKAQVVEEEEEESIPNANGVKKKKNKKKKGKEVEEIISEVRESSNKVSDSEGDDFWMPPVGERWDFDDGGDRWGSGSESEPESDEENGTDNSVHSSSQGPTSTDSSIDVEAGSKESEELSSRTKRMSIEIGPSSFASRKKKSRENMA